MTTAAALTVLVLFSLVFYILIKGIPNLKPSLFEWKYTSKNASMMPAIINTITMVLMTLLIAVPFGIGSAIYLTEYAKRGNKVVPVIRMTTETLSGIPSIVYGLFGYMAFVRWLDWGYSLMAGIITLAIMILPLIMQHHRGGAAGGAGQLPGRQLRPGCRTAAHHLPGGAAFGYAGHPLGRNPGCGPYRG